MPPFRESISKQVRGPSSRSKLACEPCRKSHVKCDQSRPCALCKRRGIDCSLCQDVTFTALEFKAPAAGLLKDFVSSKTVEGPVIATFVDETEEVADLYQVTSPSVEALSVSSDQHPSPWPVLSSHGNPVTDATDAFFLWRYIDFIGPRFDMFDDAPRYFSTVMPQLALNDTLALLACVAAAARQYYLVNDQQQHIHEQALTYYNAAIRLLSKRLQDSGPDPAVFASCLLIAHCEMVESKATAWDLHLKGTGDLLKMHGWHGMSGGLAQASFWIYCRMIILASLCAGKPAALEPKAWIPGGVFPDPAMWTLKSWQKKVVFLLGMVHDFWSRTPDNLEGHAKQLHDARWKELEAELVRLQSQAPAVCSPISILPPDGEDNPFQSVRYLNGPVSAAWQMLHTAFLILTVCTPCSLASRLSVLSSPDVIRRAQMYARQIVANSLANRCTIAWANAVQLLTIAGQCLVVDSERNACVRILREIQQQTGWNTQASIDRLGAVWESSWRYESWGNHSAVGQVDAGKLLYHVWLGEARSLS
ncbi:anhydro-N-acetylmuramic acid kinase [Aspergillus udagawae]|uniref:Anhydro-N-acetylmuramic acid kinase n=1 Tax=Aspergillus udagawae TaxID=91492 RepID=A0ABQ1ACS0_9EURO|nr:anhydro-N-acetylmuramic acid kinase [Aspergillus udagawae]GFG18158.1 anhydro-N-acetylmuramic acid kinase [Aspergillus udagawae]